MRRPRSEIDRLIDRYLAWEAAYRPRIGYPTRASGAGLSVSSRQWDSERETLDDAARRSEIDACEGAWASLDRQHDRALRIDHANRKMDCFVLRLPGLSAMATAETVRVAKRRLAHLLAGRGIDVGED